MTPGEWVTGLSYLVGAGVFVWAAKRRGLATDGIGIVAAVGFATGIVGAKVTQAIASHVPLMDSLNPQNGGRALLGGVVFGWLGVEIAKWRMGIRRSTGDLFALALPAGEAIGRIGCHLNGCCYGARCDAPWAIWQHGAYRYPAQLISAGVAGLTFVAMVWLAPRLVREGDFFRVYLVVFGVTRFGLEFIRWRESLVAGLSPMQWFCLDLMAIGTWGLWRSSRKAVVVAAEVVG